MKKTSLAIIFLLLLSLAAAYGYTKYAQNDSLFGPSLADKEAADFKLPNIEGGSIKLSDYKGKLVLLNFWASWCPPCRAEIPGFIKTQEAYSDKPFTFIGIAVEDKKNAANFAKSMKINYPIAYGLEESLSVAGKYGNPDGGLPYSVLISPEQKILHVYSGFLSEEKLIKMIEKNLPH